MKKRTRFDIIFEILKIALRDGTTKAKIIRQANINSKMADRYINFMIENNLLKESSNGEQRLFVTSEKGHKLLKEFNGVIDITMYWK